MPAQAPRRHAVYACGLVIVVSALAAGVVGWGTDAGSPPASTRGTVIRPVAAQAVRSEQAVERLAAAIVNEPLQQRALAQARQPDRAAPVRAAAADALAGAAPSRGPTRVPARVAVRGGEAAAGRAPGAPGMAATADSDVALLAALMAHASGADAGGHMAGVAGPAAAQLRRCARLSGAQATQCQARACAGHWGQSSACRVTVAE
ncbi:hypothetical protein ACHMW6_23775 [Pseudoduganella sp. UC29_106]|uniref:hypothetical protein n=1 Tax=Pseudoduganella sp. UC29_106 TaxID=3374553 RepID=UPI00375796BE